MIFRIPSGQYDDDFIQGLVLAVTLKLLKPNEVEAMFYNDKLPPTEIAKKCLTIIKTRIARKKRK